MISLVKSIEVSFYCNNDTLTMFIFRHIEFLILPEEFPALFPRSQRISPSWGSFLATLPLPPLLVGIFLY